MVFYSITLPDVSILILLAFLISIFLVHELNQINLYVFCAVILLINYMCFVKYLPVVNVVMCLG